MTSVRHFGSFYVICILIYISLMFVCLSVRTKKNSFPVLHVLFFPPHEGQVEKAILKMSKNELRAKRVIAEWRIGVGERI